MGREVTCMCRTNADEGKVKAHLEADQIILRGNTRRVIALATVSDVRAEGEAVHFQVGDDRIVLEMGVREAALWAAKMTTPPPALSKKLGLSPSSKALTVGPVDDPALQEALQGTVTRKAAEAKMLIATVADEDGLAEAVQSHARLPDGAPLWIVYRKGPKSTFGEQQVRDAMRSQGFVDNKVAAVSAQLTAARFSRTASAVGSG